MIDPVTENGQHFWYLAFARKRTKPVEAVKESYSVKAIERTAPIQPTKPLNKNYIHRNPEKVNPNLKDPRTGRWIDTYA